MTPVRLEPAAPRSRVKHSTTEPLRSLAAVVIGPLRVKCPAPEPITVGQPTQDCDPDEPSLDESHLRLSGKERLKQLLATQHPES